MSVAAWVVARAGREEQVGVVEAARAPEAAVARAQAKLGQEVAAARARETRAVAVAEAAVAVVKAAEAGVAQEPLGLVAAVGRAQAAPAAVVEAGMAPESASRPERARRTALIQGGEAPATRPCVDIRIWFQAQSRLLFALCIWCLEVQLCFCLFFSRAAWHASPGIARRGSRGMYSWWKDKFRVWWNGRLGQGKGILWTYNHSGTANRAIPLSRWRMPSVRELTTIL